MVHESLLASSPQRTAFISELQGCQGSTGDGAIQRAEHEARLRKIRDWGIESRQTMLPSFWLRQGTLQ